MPFNKGVKMEFGDESKVLGWDLIKDDKGRAVARYWLSSIGSRMEHQLKVTGSTATSWKACLRAEIDDATRTIVGEYETAYAVRMPNGALVLGIAPTSRSASYRAMKLLRHGYCAAAGLPSPMNPEPSQCQAVAMPR